MIERGRLEVSAEIMDCWARACYSAVANPSRSIPRLDSVAPQPVFVTLDGSKLKSSR